MTPGVPGDGDRRRRRLSELLDFARGAAAETGFGWLEDDGSLRATGVRELWVNARMTYVFATAHRHGLPDTQALARHGVETLLGAFRDPVHDGWFSTIDTAGPVDDAKACYEHDFVLLAGCAATDADVTGGLELRDAALAVHERRFWDEKAGRCRESWSRDWTTPEDYRGANSNMHAVETYLAAAASTGDRVWLGRAASIVDGIVGVAREHEWRVVEHFDASWQPLLDLNRDRPNDPFRPYGATPGHGFEWARLVVQLHEALADSAPDDAQLLRSARALFERAATDTADGERGICYTTDWHGRPVVAERFHWVLCEALLAADALARVVPDPERYLRLRQAWWELADTYFVDHEQGSWHHELSADLVPTATTWQGKPDAYHAFNALLLTAGDALQG